MLLSFLDINSLGVLLIRVRMLKTREQCCLFRRVEILTLLSFKALFVKGILRR